MTNTNDEPFAQQDERQETLGPLLKAARESKGMSVKDIADRLHLRPSIVNDIESDSFSDIASSTYVRGYVKNFTRIVEAPEDRIMACLARQVPSVTEPSMQSFSRKTTRQARDNRLMWVTYLIVAVLVTLLVVWWVQKSQLLSGNDFSQPTVEEIAESNKVVSSGAEQDTVEPESSDANIDSSRHDAVPRATPANTKAETIVPNVPVTASVVESASRQISDQTSESAGNVAELTAEPVNNDVVSAPVQLDAGMSELKISLTGDCWIKAVDANGKVLINDLKKRGRTVSVTGLSPFKLVLGAPQVVTIQLDGKTLDMSQLPRNKVARITIPM